MIKIATLQNINSITNMQVITISLKDFRHSLEDNTEKLLYASRWVLSPMYILLIVVLILILINL